MNYIKIELRQGIPLDTFYPRVNNKINWENFGSSVQAIKLDTLVITGMKEADGDYVYLLPIVDEAKATQCKAYMETFSQVSGVSILTEAEAIAERTLIENYNKGISSLTPLEQAKADKTKALDEWYIAQQNEIYSTVINSKSINTRLTDKVITGLNNLVTALDDVAYANNLTAEQKAGLETNLWYNADKTQIDVTYAELILIRLFIAQQLTIIATTQKTAEAQIYSATTIEEVNNIEF